MALTYQDYTANGSQTSFVIPFDRIRDVHVKVFFDTTEVTTGWSVVGNNVVFSTAPANGTAIRIRRITDFTERLVDFVDGSRLNEVDLDADSKQSFYLLQESREINDVSMVKNSSGNWEAGFDRIQSVSSPVENFDAVNKLYLDQTANNFANYGVGAPATRWAFTGNGTALVFSITGATLTTSTYYLVTVNGSVSDPAAYTVTPNTLTFNSAPANASAIVVVLLGYPRMTNENTVSNVSIKSDAAIEFSKLAALNSANILVGNGSNVATKVAVTGDVTISNAGVTTIGNNKVVPAMLSQPYTLVTSKAFNWNGLTTNKVIDFDGIPSWAKRITVMFDSVSTNGTTRVQVQLGDAGGIEATGYLSSATQTTENVNVGGVGAFTTGFPISYGTTGASRTGALFINLMSGNKWVANGVMTDNNSASTSQTAGVKTLSDTLTQVRITTTNGADNFDAGSVAISYEG